MSQTPPRAVTKFWAKTTEDGNPGVSVVEHMLNVGCVAREFARLAGGLLDLFGLQTPEVAALAGLHDIGKLSPGFQRKCEAWLIENGLVTVARNWTWNTTTEADHAKVTQATVQPLLQARRMPRKPAALIAAILGAHHGRIKHAPDDRGWRIPGITEDASKIDWDSVRSGAAETLLSYFGAQLDRVSIVESSSALWWLAGLIAVADWIGSDERFFAPEGGLADSDRLDQAARALTDIGFSTPAGVSGQSFADAFGLDPNAQPNDMQDCALDTIQGPGIYVIEAPMGMGKTEAALWVAYKLLESGKASGIYFALPTQATSNRMHVRLATFLSRTIQGASHARLIHGNSWLLEGAIPLHPAATASTGWQDDARTGRDWFASAKRALLAPFGVGTIDQALLGVVSAKHFFVRHFALAGKVVILDEVHSYDLYTGTLIEKLARTLDGLGCTVIVLSATLTKERRDRLLALKEGPAVNGSSEDYPLISGVAKHGGYVQVGAKAPAAREVDVAFEGSVELRENAVRTASNGGTVLWVCNTIAIAQATYQNLKAMAGPNVKVGLLHSRFPFWRREELEQEWMTRLGKSSTDRDNCILVSTQVVEQSVDLDADLLITELAPTDMILQRTGRLWRHERGPRTLSHPQICIVEESKTLQEFQCLEPKAIIEALGAKAYVYSPYVLVRSLAVWSKRKKVSIPSEIRGLIAATYNDLDEEPTSWQQLRDELFGSDLAKKFRAAQAANLWTVPLEDVEGVQTRLNEQPTVAVALCRSINDTTATFLDGTEESVSIRDFRLRTAQAIHRNLVRVPKHRFATVKPCGWITDYVHGDQALGIVTDSGEIQIDGLKDGSVMRWDNVLGVTVESRNREA